MYEINIVPSFESSHLAFSTQVNIISKISGSIISITEEVSQLFSSVIVIKYSPAERLFIFDDVLPFDQLYV